MSLNFNLTIETNFNSIEILHFLSKMDDFDFKWEENFLFGSGVMVYATQENDVSQSIIEEAFGFKPFVLIEFRINPTSEYNLGKLTVLQATTELMKRFLGNIVLLFNGETIVLQCIGNQLLLNQDFGKWTESELSCIKLPYELKSLPSPLI